MGINILAECLAVMSVKELKKLRQDLDILIKDREEEDNEE